MTAIQQFGSFHEYEQHNLNFVEKIHTKNHNRNRTDVFYNQLFQGKWIPRRSDNNPKTIEQIHQEAAKEAQDRAVQAQLHAQQKASQKGGGGGGKLFCQKCRDLWGGGGGGSLDTKNI